MKNKYEIGTLHAACSSCGGSGVIELDLDDEGSDYGTEECAACGGTGHD